jgi:hypothetical protein
MSTPDRISLTAEEISNGWDAASLERYRRDRDKVADVIPGNVVTEFKRSKPGPIIHGARKFNPHKW